MNSKEKTTKKTTAMTFAESARLAKKAKCGDEEARTALFAEITRLARREAAKYARSEEELDDLTQDGLVAALEGLERFDPKKRKGKIPPRFSTFVTPWIRGAVCKKASDPKDVQTVKKAIAELQIALERDPREDEVAVYLSGLLPKSAVEAILRSGEIMGELSLNAIPDGCEDASIEDLIASDDSPTEEFSEADGKEIVSEALDRLGPKTRRILVLFFGLEGENPHTHREIAKEFGVTSERIRQLQNRGLHELRRDPEVYKRLKSIL